MTKTFMNYDVSHECSMTISSSPVGQNFVQVYVFVRKHWRFCHSSFVYKKKRRAFALLNLFCRGLVVIFFTKRRQFSWSFHSSFFLFLSYFLFLLEGRPGAGQNSKRKKIFWILFWKFFLKSGPAGLFSELFYFVYSSSIIVIVHDASEWISRYPWWGSVTRPLKIPRYPWRVLLHDTSEHYDWRGSVKRPLRCDRKIPRYPWSEWSSFTDSPPSQ